MSLRTVTVAALLAGALSCLTGFTWGFGGDSCKDAIEAAQKLPLIVDDVQRTKEEQEIVRVCPDGAAAQYIQGVTAERQGNSDAAVAAYRRALQSEPNFSVARGSLGLVYLARGRQDDGVVELTKAVAGQPIPAFHAALGQVMAEKRLFALALYHYGEASLRAPSDATIITGQADVYAAQGETIRAVDEYKRALFLDPRSEAAAIGLATVHLQQNQPDAGLAVLTTLPATVTVSPKRHLLLADLYERKGEPKKAESERMLGGKKPKAQPTPKVSDCAVADQLASTGELEKAIEAYRQGLQKNPDSLEGYEKLGNLYFRTNKFDEAAKAYQHAMHLGTKNADVYYNLGQIYEKRGKIDEAIVSYKQAIERYPEFADARLHLADIRMGRGNTQDAIEQYIEYLKLRPNNGEIHLRLARIFAKNKNFNLAEGSYLQGLRLMPDNPDVHRELAGIYRTKGLQDKALQHYNQALKLLPTDSESRNAIVAIYVKDKKYDELVTLLKDAVKVTPEDPNNHYKLGLIYDFKKDHENAIESYKKATELKPDHARALNALGRVYMKTGRLAEAKSALESAKKADPTMEEASVLLNNIRDEFNPVPRKIKDIKVKKGKKGKKDKKGKKGSKKSKSTSKKGASKKKSKKKSDE